MKEQEMTFMQAIYDGAEKASLSEAGKMELSGFNREQFLASVKAVTDGMSVLPPETSLHVTLLAVTFVRNTLIMAMKANEAVLMRHTGGEG